jgi:rhamnose transport system ATP-binding protein
MTSPLLQLTSVTKSFGAVRALKDVSFTLQAGEVHALVGENGAGKSTLIKLITGAHQPDGGTIEINGHPVHHLTPAIAHKFGIACIYQQPALFPDLTVAENIALRLEPATAIRCIRWSERRGHAAQLLRRAGAEISPDVEAGSLSMPEQQLVEIARALGAGARIVIMDEPTASLTRKEQQRLFDVVRDLRRCGVGIIYISHRLEEIFALADRVTVLRDGETVGTRQIRSSRDNETHDKVECEKRKMENGHATDSSQAATDQSPVTSTATITESELIKLMVGREVSQIYPLAESALGDVVLSLKNVGCAAAGVRAITLEAHAGEVVGLAGLVGAGRTELARVLFGIRPADSGEIHLNGKLVTIHSPREAVARGIAYVPEDRRRHGVILDMPIAANVTMAIHRNIFPDAWLRFGAEKKLALDYIRDLDIRAYGPEAPGNFLSGGNQQKVALARWLAANPRVLILDEPTQGVDVGAKSEIHKIIRRVTKAGLAVLMISSDLSELLGMCDRIAVMRGGTIVATLPGRSDAHDVMTAALGHAVAK